MATPIPDNGAEFSLEQVAHLCGGRANAAARSLGDRLVRGVSTDTRAALGDKLFVALKGERFDAHAYVEQALAAGATCALVEREVSEQLPAIVVSSTLEALGALAREHRRRWGKQLIAVAGSAGKTTTRSLISAVVSRLWPDQALTVSGNLNNRIGVPMVLFGLGAQHELAVIEIGTNQTGEVAALSAVSEPDLGVLTLIDLEHTEGLGTLDDIEREEGALLAHTRRRALGNGDDARVHRQLCEHPELSPLLYGYEPHNHYRVLRAELDLEQRGDLRLQMRVMVERAGEVLGPGIELDASRLEFVTPFLGRPGVLASVAALATAEVLAKRRLTRAELEPALFLPSARQAGRLQPHLLADGTLLIDDSYNANPASVLAGLELAQQLAAARRGRLHVVLGEMRELGELSQREHQRIGEALPQFKPASLVAICGHARHFITDELHRAAFVEDSSQVLQHLRPHLTPGDVVFVKASRGVAAERVINDLKQ